MFFILAFLALSPLLENSLAILILCIAIVGFLAFILRFQTPLWAMCMAVAGFLKAHFGANWRTTLTALGTALFAILTGLAALPYQIGPIADIIPPNLKATVVTVAGIATAILHILNGVLQKDRSVTGGSVEQDTTGQVVPNRRIILEDEETGTKVPVQPATPSPAETDSPKA